MRRVRRAAIAAAMMLATPLPLRARHVFRHAFIKECASCRCREPRRYATLPCDALPDAEYLIVAPYLCAMLMRRFVCFATPRLFE